MTAEHQTTPGTEAARRELAALTQHNARLVSLGCSLVSHRDLGFCAACLRDSAAELVGWRLLAIVDRGHVDQPWEPS